MRGFSLRLFLVDNGVVFGFETDDFVVFHRESNEDVRADGDVAANHRIAAKDRGARIDDDVIFNRGMALLIAEFIGVLKRLRAEGDALVDADVIANDRRLADNHARAMVDEEIMTDRRAWMDINARGTMGKLAHHAGQDGYAFLI